MEIKPPLPKKPETRAPVISPKKAALFSLVIPGSGQLYNGDFGRGFAILVGALAGLFPFIIPGLLVWGFGVYDAYTRVTRMNAGEVTSKSDISGPVVIILVLAIGLAPFMYTMGTSIMKVPSRLPQASGTPAPVRQPVATPAVTQAPASGPADAVTEEPVPTQTQKIVMLPDGNFTEVLNETYQFVYTSSSIPVSVGTPPLLIDYTLSPKITTNEKVLTGKSGVDQTVTATYFSPTAWFELTLRDNSTGDIVLEDGFGGTFGSDTHKRVPWYRPGEYNLTMRGNDITADVEVLVKSVV